MTIDIILARIADAYLPILGLWLMYELIISENQRAQIIVIVTTGACIYGMMCMDKIFGIWPSINLDYSTHTATAVGLCFLIGRQVGLIKGGFLGGSFIGYCSLLNYLKYHSWNDIFSTTLYMVVAITVTTYTTKKISVYQQGELN